MPTVKPMPGKVFVRILDEKKEVAGLYIPEAKRQYNETFLKAEILEIGRTVKSVEPGDLVLINGSAGRWIGPEITQSKETHRILEEDEIVALIEPMGKRNARA